MKWLKGSAQFLSVATVLSLGACTKHANQPNTPEGALEQYVNTAFSAKSVSDKQKLLNLSTGDAQNWLLTLDDQAFKRQFIDNSMIFQSMKMKDLRREESGDVSLVYELTFKDGKTPNAAAYTNKKIAFLTQDKDGQWRIKATKNVKSVVERKDDLVVPPNTPETTDKENGAERK